MMKKVLVFVFLSLLLSVVAHAQMPLSPVNGLSSGIEFTGLVVTVLSGQSDGGTLGYCAVATNAGGTRISNCGIIVYSIVNQAGTITATYTVIGATENSPGAATITLAAPTATSTATTLNVRTTITITNFTPTSIVFHRKLVSFQDLQTGQ